MVAEVNDVWCNRLLRKWLLGRKVLDKGSLGLQSLYKQAKWSCEAHQAAKY